ncbi:MAG: hypothetical protein KGJ75_00205 [Alphaproteobacteria bacterium]|nr:hypothetical protein [Alphaproteobacteria bacterium]MDE2073187.1 hypothetical protein [Alphaproteobacteria bacterium]
MGEQTFLVDGGNSFIRFGIDNGLVTILRVAKLPSSGGAYFPEGLKKVVARISPEGDEWEVRMQDDEAAFFQCDAGDEEAVFNWVRSKLENCRPIRHGRAS